MPPPGPCSRQQLAGTRQACGELSSREEEDHVADVTLFGQMGGK